MGICGTAMGNVALMLRRLGHEVSGADEGIYPPMSDFLAQAGIEVMPGWDPPRLEAHAPDIVVIGNDITSGTPELEWLLETRLFRCESLPALLRELILARRHNLVIAGTHGKTTTTALAATLLRAAGEDPGYLIGGVPHGLSSGAAPGADGGPFIIEGDEYDSAFFDKRGKFIHYAPNVLVINNIEYDHADIFRDLEDVLRSFRHVTRLIPRNGALVVNADDSAAAGLAESVTWAPVYTFGTTAGSDLQVDAYQENQYGSSFVLRWRGGDEFPLAWKPAGRFNALNAAAAALGCALLGGLDSPLRLPLTALETFQGVRRRQELLAEAPGWLAFEDFGHHPTAIRKTLAAFRGRFPDAELIACFEPRSNTARSSVLEAAFGEALSGADRVFISPVHRAGAVPAAHRFSPARVAAALTGKGLAEAVACPDAGSILTRLQELRATPARARLVCFFSNGSFNGISRRFASMLQEK